jgi:hypothetical protein
MHRWQSLVNPIWLLGLLTMCVFVPRVKVVRVYDVWVCDSLASNTREPYCRPGNEVRQTRTEPGGYGWVSSTFSSEGPDWTGQEVEYQINWGRLGLQVAAWGLVGLAVAVVTGRPPRLD